MTERAPRGRRLIAYFAVFALLWISAPGCEAGAPSEAESGLARGTATIRQQAVQIELARTPAEQALGLGQRDELAWGDGMLFPYERAGFISFWMKGMRFPIDIVWIREHRIVGIAHRVPPPETPDAAPATARSPEMIDMVLEVPAGYAQAHGWSRGDRVSIAE